jgi:hypothetical protein
VVEKTEQIAPSAPFSKFSRPNLPIIATEFFDVI